MLKTLITAAALLLLPSVALGSTHQEAFEDSEQCEVDGGIFRGPSGWDFYCSTPDQLEACESVSELLDCSDMSAEACDVAMGRVYEACLIIADRTGAVR